MYYLLERQDENYLMWRCNAVKFLFCTKLNEFQSLILHSSYFKMFSNNEVVRFKDKGVVGLDFTSLSPERKKY